MTSTEKAAIRAVIKALFIPRNRFGALDRHYSGETASAGDDLQALIYETPGIPHGGADKIDQATMLLQSLVGDPIRSIIDN